MYPPPPIQSSFAAGFAAGTVSSVIAAPLDALAVRFKTSEVLSGRYRTMWQYGYKKLHEIGARGVFAGWGLAFVKDSLGYGAFFAAFEYTKAQAYYSFVNKFYGDFQPSPFEPLLKRPHIDDIRSANLIKPYWALAPMFLLLAGIAASIAQQMIQHPLTTIQNVHFKTLDYLERQAQAIQSQTPMIRTHPNVYRRTY